MPAELELLIRQSLAKELKHRSQSARDLARALRAVASNSELESRVQVSRKPQRCRAWAGPGHGGVALSRTWRATPAGLSTSVTALRTT